MHELKASVKFVDKSRAIIAWMLRLKLSKETLEAYLELCQTAMIELFFQEWLTA